MNQYVITSLLLVFSSHSWAQYICTGKVKGLAIAPNSGAVHAEKVGPLTWPVLCSVQTDDYNGISAETCKVIYSTLLTAQMADKNVTLWFRDGKDCTLNSHPAWSTLTGWYFGPKIHN